MARAHAALDKPYVDKIVVEDNLINVKFDVYDHFLESMPLTDLTTSYDLKRECRVEQFSKEVNSNGQDMLLMVSIRDEKTIENDDGEKIEEKIAYHNWILNLQRGRHAPVVTSHHQIMFDMASGGDIDLPVSTDQYVPATSYLRKCTRTTEEVVQMIEELLKTKETPLDFSTVQ